MNFSEDGEGGQKNSITYRGEVYLAHGDGKMNIDFAKK
jgi:hypothetical protein